MYVPPNVIDQVLEGGDGAQDERCGAYRVLRTGDMSGFRDLKSDDFDFLFGSEMRTTSLWIFSLRFAVV